MGTRIRMWCRNMSICINMTTGITCMVMRPCLGVVGIRTCTSIRRWNMCTRIGRICITGMSMGNKACQVSSAKGHVAASIASQNKLVLRVVIFALIFTSSRTGTRDPWETCGQSAYSVTHEHRSPWRDPSDARQETNERRTRPSVAQTLLRDNWRGKDVGFWAVQRI